MLLVHRDARDYLEAVCEWWLVDSKGQYNVRGAYVFVNQLDCSPGVNGRKHIQQFIQEIALTAPWALGAYWRRSDKPYGMYRGYRRSQLCRQRQEVMV